MTGCLQDLTVTVASCRSPYEIELAEDETEMHSVNRRSFIDEQEWYLYKFISTEKREIVNDYTDPSVVRMAVCVKCQAARRPAYFFWNIFLITVRVTHYYNYNFLEAYHWIVCMPTMFQPFGVDQLRKSNRNMLDTRKLNVSFDMLLLLLSFAFTISCFVSASS